MKNLIYLLEDDEAICDLIDCAFTVNGLNVEYFRTVNEFESAIKRRLPDLALLDVMLPDGNGLEVLKRIKKTSPDLYCIMLSALGSETDKVKGFNIGADDYVSKPFGTMELVARVKAALRRIGGNKSIIEAGSLILNSETMTATLNGKALDISATEYSLLYYFCINKGKVLSRDAILSYLRGEDGGESRTLDNYISHLRKSGVKEITTVFGVGYKFEV